MQVFLLTVMGSEYSFSESMSLLLVW